MEDIVICKYNAPFLMSSPLNNCCKSSVKLFGATYSAAAVLMALEMNPETKGRFITFGKALLSGMTEMSILGRPINVTIVVLILNRTKVSV
jgi:hypothetical protein